jgi:predicted Fe-Mo cluster-binding NifX family protein
MKIAVVTNDGKTINRHFGRARFYLVVTMEGGRVIDRELRPKAGHDDFVGRGHESHEPGEPRGYGHGATKKHRAMTQAILDCGVLIAGGMGQGASASLQACGIQTVLTDERDISEAIERLVQGNLPNLLNRLH